MTFSTFQQNMLFSGNHGNHGELLLFFNFKKKTTKVVNYAPDAHVKERQLHVAGTKRTLFSKSWI